MGFQGTGRDLRQAATPKTTAERQTEAFDLDPGPGKVVAYNSPLVSQIAKNSLCQALRASFLGRCQLRESFPMPNSMHTRFPAYPF